MIKTVTNYQEIDLTKINASRTNPRKSFDKKALAELTESIKEKGVIQPIVIRPIPNNGHFEIVAGERRFKASQNAGKKTIPAIIRELDEQEAYELQVVENLQREDLHPLEEAEGFEELMKKYNYKGANQIADKVGKTTAYVYNRMKLLALIPYARKKFFANELTPSTALLIARMPETLQEKACKDITEGRYGEGPMTYKRASEYIEWNFMLSLNKAPFDVKSADLCPEAGACIHCMKKTGNDRLLFADISSKDTCTDPKCFAKKKKMAWKLETEKYKKQGFTIGSNSSGERLFCGGNINSWGANYDLKDVCELDKQKRKYSELLKGIDNKRIVIVKDDKQKIHKIIKKKVADKFMQEKGYKFIQIQETNQQQSEEERRISKIKDALIVENICNEVISNVEGGKSLKTIFEVMISLLTSNIQNFYPIAKRRNIAEDSFNDYVKKLSQQQIFGLIAELVIVDELSWDEGFCKKTCKNFSLDFKKISKQCGVQAKEIRKQEIEETKKGGDTQEETQ